MSGVRREGLVLGNIGKAPAESSGGPLPSEEEQQAVRERAATALERGLAFVDAHGAPLTRLRARAVLGAVTAEECALEVAGQQRPDGSFPLLGLADGGAPGFASPEQAGLDVAGRGTLEALVVLSDLGMQHHPCVEGAARFMQSIQGADGSWGLAEKSPEARIFPTGMVAGLLGRTRVARPELLESAGEFLEGLFNPERVSESRWEVLTAFGLFFTNVGHELSDTALQWIGRELERGHRTRARETVLTLRTLLHCQTLAIPGASLDPFLLLTDLLGEQGADGGFAELAAGENALRVEPTLDAMAGTIHLCGSF